MTVYGISLGPDEADLVTVKGRRLLESAATVYLPGRLSRAVALNHVPEERVGDPDLPMTCDPDELRRAWREITAEVAARADSKGAAFVTLGDPNVYSTFDHLRCILDTPHPEVDLEVVLGVSTVTALMTVFGIEVESRTGLALREAVNGAAPTDPDHMMPLKVTDAPATHEKLTETGYDTRFGRRLFVEQGETVIIGDPDEFAERNYYTLTYAEREGVGRDVATAEFDGVELGGSV